MNPTKAILLIAFCALTFLLDAQQVIISEDANPSGHPSAILDIQSNDKGLLIPRVTTAVRDTMNSAPDGMLVFDSDLGALFCKSGGVWEKLEMPNNVFEKVGGIVKPTESFATDDFVFGSPTLHPQGNEDYHERMFFDKSRAAFRAGIEFGNSWLEDSIGFYSFAGGFAPVASGAASTAFGISSKAIGIGSTAFGRETTASGDESTAFGNQSVASGDLSFSGGSSSIAAGLKSFAFGHYAKANGDFSTAIGFGSEANGLGSTAFGSYVYANSISSTAIGRYNDPIIDVGESCDDCPLFMVGNGLAPQLGVPPNPTIPEVRSNAMTVYHSGKTALGNITPTEILDIDGSIRMREGAAAGYVPVSDAGGAMTWTDPNNVFSSPWSVIGNYVFRSSGNVGIGTSTPSEKLHVTENVQIDGIMNIGNVDQTVLPNAKLNIQDGSITLSEDQSLAFINESGNLTSRLQSTDANLHFFVGNNPRMILTQNGNLGIGHFLNPTERLDVDGKVRMRSGAMAGYLPVSDSDGVMTWTDPQSIGLIPPWSVNGSDVYRSSGNVGIGTTTPSVPLDLFYNNSAGLDTMVKFRNSLGGPNDLLFFSNASIYNNFSPMMQGRVDDNNIAALYIQANSSEDLANGSPMMVFSSRKLDSNVSNRPLYHWRNYNTTLMAMAANGNLGINTSDPQEKLHVVGNSIFTGNLGIGTILPQAKLHVAGDSKIDGSLILDGTMRAGNSSGLQFSTSNGMTRMRILENGNTHITNRLGIENSTPQTELHLTHSNMAYTADAGLRLDSGDGEDWTINMRSGSGVNFESDLHFWFGSSLKSLIRRDNGAYIQMSDGRLKENIQPLSGLLSSILLLKPKQYLYKSQLSDKNSLGFIAQEVQDLFPQAVHSTPEGMLSLDYSVFGVLAIQAIKEQQVLIENLEKQNALHAQKIKEQDQRILQLAKQIEMVIDNLENN